MQPRTPETTGPTSTPSADVSRTLILREPFDAAETRRIMELLARRWTLQILAELADGPLRRNRLSDRIPGVSEKVLTDTLRELEWNSIVQRTFYEGTPPRVDYAMTERGELLTKRLARLVAWILSGADGSAAAAPTPAADLTSPPQTEPDPQEGLQ